jgi:hypothetical protein
MTPEEYKIIDEHYKSCEDELYHSSIESELYDLEGVTLEAITEYCDAVLEKKALELMKEPAFPKLFAATQRAGYSDGDTLRYIHLTFLGDLEVTRKAIELSKQIEEFRGTVL